MHSLSSLKLPRAFGPLKIRKEFLNKQTKQREKTRQETDSGDPKAGQKRNGIELFTSATKCEINLNEDVLTSANNIYTHTNRRHWQRHL